MRNRIYNKLILFLILTLQSFLLNAQINKNWALGKNALVTFSLDEPIVSQFRNDKPIFHPTLSASDDNGNFLFYCGVYNVQSNICFSIFNANDEELLNLKINISFMLSSTYGYKYKNDYYLFVMDYNEYNIITIILTQEKTGEIVVKDQIITPSPIRKLCFFMPYENKEGSLMLLAADSDMILIYKYDESKWNFYSKKLLEDNFWSEAHRYDVKPVVSKNKILISGIGFFTVIDFDFRTGTIKSVFSKKIPNLTSIELSKSEKYLYMHFIKYSGQFCDVDILEYSIDDIDNFNYDENYHVVFSGKNLKKYFGYSDMLLAPDGNIYLGYLAERYLSRIINVDTKNPIFQKDVVDLGEGNVLQTFFPRISRDCFYREPIPDYSFCQSITKEYFIENSDKNSKYFWEITPSNMGKITSKSENSDNITITWQEAGFAQLTVYQVDENSCQSEKTSLQIEILQSPDAQFDNAQVCYGENLKVLLNGSAPFNLEYTLDNKLFTVKEIMENEYIIPNQSGKYSLTKISDKNCEVIPAENSNAIIGSQMKNLEIKLVK